MKLFRVLESIILHDCRALRPHPFENDGSFFRLKFFSHRFSIDRVYVEYGKRLGRADPNMDRPGTIHVLHMEQMHSP
jgi:hypothetical protein